MNDNKTNDKPEDGRSEIKDLTIGQFFEVIDYIKKFWLVIVALVSAAYFSVTYFATSKSVEKLACQAERRVMVERHRSSVTLLERQKEDLSNQQANFLKLQSILLEIQLSNPSVGLDLSKLKSEMKFLIDEAGTEKKEKAKEIDRAKDDLKAAESVVNECGKEKT